LQVQTNHELFSSNILLWSLIPIDRHYFNFETVDSFGLWITKLQSGNIAARQVHGRASVEALLISTENCTVTADSN